ncbi:hypothetical protein NHJ13734_003502 [Beauveria thailandica]
MASDTLPMFSRNTSISFATFSMFSSTLSVQRRTYTVSMPIYLAQQLQVSSAASASRGRGRGLCRGDIHVRCVCYAATRRSRTVAEESSGASIPDGLAAVYLFILFIYPFILLFERACLKRLCYSCEAPSPPCFMPKP